MNLNNEAYLRIPCILSTPTEDYIEKNNFKKHQRILAGDTHITMPKEINTIEQETIRQKRDFSFYSSSCFFLFFFFFWLGGCVCLLQTKIANNKRKIRANGHGKSIQFITTTSDMKRTRACL